MDIDSLIKTEDGIKVIDIEELVDDTSIGKYDLLSELFHTESISIDKDISVTIQKNGTKRYFDRGIQCYNCNEIGHTMWKCPSAQNNTCIYCMIDHTGSRCPYIFCTGCHNLGHHEKSCREKKLTQRKCTNCKYQSHLNTECPRVWRRYKLRNRNVTKKFKMCCAFCYETSHFIGDCKMVEDSQITIFTKKYLKLLEKQ